MTRFFKSAAFPIIIVIILAFFASKLISSGDRAEKTTFSQFLTQLAQFQQLENGMNMGQDIAAIRGDMDQLAGLTSTSNK